MSPAGSPHEPWRPPPALRPYVAGLHAYDLDLGRPGVHRGLPGTTVTLVLPLDQPLDVGWSGDETSRERRWSTVSGLHTRPAAIHHDGTQKGLQLALTAAGARALLGMPAAAVSRELLTLEEAVPDLAELPEQLAGAPDPTTALRIVERALVAALARHGEAGSRAEVGHALARLTRGARVGDVAADVGFSRRHLGALVRAECGVTPKELQRVARFQRSRDLLVRAARTGTRDLAGVAASSGYADQAHLTREWRRLAGCTPTTWLREELPFVQDPAPDGDAG